MNKATSPVARQSWNAAASFKGDFQDMSVKPFSEMTYYTALALLRLGKASQRHECSSSNCSPTANNSPAPPRLIISATSLPTMLVFNDDIQFRQGTTALFLQAQALLGLGRRKTVPSLFEIESWLAIQTMLSRQISNLPQGSTESRLREPPRLHKKLFTLLLINYQTVLPELQQRQSQADQSHYSRRSGQGDRPSCHSILPAVGENAKLGAQPDFVALNGTPTMNRQIVQPLHQQRFLPTSRCDRRRFVAFQAAALQQAKKKRVGQI